MNFPLVSVIIPTYNYASYICEAVNSILQQDYPSESIEIVIVDDGSTDDTENVLKPFIENSLVRYFYQANMGKAAATSRAINLSKGKFIFNLDADDVFLPGKIRRCVHLYEQDVALVHIASPAKIIELASGKEEVEKIPEDILGKKNDGRELLEYFYDENILYGGGSTFSARASVLKGINIPGTVNMYIDEFLIIAVLNKGASYFFKEPLSVWNIHGNNYTANSNKERTIKKQRELLKNSTSMLDELAKGGYTSRFFKAYVLKHETRKLYFLELWNEKKLSDVIRYIKVLIRYRISFYQIRKHSAFTRLLPAKLLFFLRNMIK